MYDFWLTWCSFYAATHSGAKDKIFCIQNYPLCFYVWDHAPYTPSTANQLKCSSLCSIISLDSWFRLFIPYSQLTLALLAPDGISHSGPGGNRQLWPDENSQS